MIILFEENEKSFTSLGIGALRDAKSCIVKEELNDSFELEMTYPIDGLLYDKIKIGRILLAKPTPYAEEEPFRINYISKPINGIVSINAVHISYDMNGIPVKPISGTSLKDTLDKIQNETLIRHDFNLYTDKTDTKTFVTHNYYNMRALLVGSDDSVLDQYKGDVLFNKFNVYLLQHRGDDRGAQVRYAKNMKDITHEINYDRLYNKVYPFYHKETSSETSSSEEGEFKKVYVVGNKPYQDGWLSYSEGGEPYHPVDESPVQVVSDGNFYEKVFTWDTVTQRYIERIYNETVTLIDGLGNLLSSENTPTWIYIDWTKIPRIIVKANQEGYFKTITDTDWSSKKKKGDVILDASITEVGSNLIMYYSEVIPTSSATLTEDTTQVTHIELKDKFIDIETEAAKEMLYDRVLMLNLSSEFDETPTEDQLEAKAKEYIEENKIGQYKYNTSVSFVDLSSTTEGAQYKNFEKIELGDSVEVVYEDLGVDIHLRVVSTEYNVILDRYNKINLGETPEKISGESVQYGDDVSSLTNDVGYADVNTVNKLIAKQITADLIEAKNAKLSKAQIEELSTARIKVTGMIEATQFELDTLIAKMLIADNAKIKETLEAGQIKVKGDIEVTKGQITIQSAAEDGTSIVFKVDRDGNVEANSVKIYGGELNINDTFVVTPDGIMTAMGASISGDVVITSGSITLGSNFRVDPDGTMYASNATISGDISASTGHIAGFVIESNRLHDSDNKIILSPGYQITVDSIVKKWTILSGVTINGTGLETIYSAKFKVADDGSLYASEAIITGKITSNDATISGGSITITNNGTEMFKVTNTGVVTAKDINITGGSLNINDMFTVSSAGIMTANGAIIQNGNISITSGSILIQDTNQNTNFSVDQHGNLSANSVNITGGTLSINSSDASVNIGADGTLTANNAIISGNITAKSGYIGTSTKGFTINENSIFNGFNSISSSALSGGIYLGTDGIRIGQDVSRGDRELGSNITVYVNSSTNFSIYDSLYPNDDYSGGIFQISMLDTRSYDRWLEFTPVKSDYSVLYDAKMISVKIPANVSTVVLDGSEESGHGPALTQSQYFKIRLVTNGTATSEVIWKITLKTLSGFMVDQYGFVIMRDATIKGSFQGDVNITGGSINIQNGAGTQVVSIDSNGNLTANSVTLSGGTIGGLKIYSNYITFNDTSNNNLLKIYGQVITPSGNPRTPTYQMYASSFYASSLIFGHGASDTADSWFESKDCLPSSAGVVNSDWQYIAGLYTWTGSAFSSSSERGFIPTTMFNNVPYFYYIYDQLYVKGNPRVHLTRQTIGGDQTYSYNIRNCQQIIGALAQECGSTGHSGNITFRYGNGDYNNSKKVYWLNYTSDSNEYYLFVFYYPVNQHVSDLDV